MLAAAPVGAWMPLEVVVAALRPEDRDGETLAVRVRDGVVALGELLARADAGSPDERVGPAHDLIADFLRGHFGADAVTGAHSAIVQALAELEQGGPPSSVAAYARDRLSEHLWAMGRSEAALSALPELPTPADNLALWQSWHRNLLQRLGPGHPDTLTTRHNLAYWTGQAGDARGALELATALLPDRQRVLGPDHPNTLTTRHNLAYWTGQAGDARGALELFTALLPDRQRVLGPDHPDTLTTRSNIAAWTGQAGDARGALELFTALLPDQQRVLGPDHPNTLATRNNIAGWTGESGDARGALELFTALLPDQQRVLGPDHPNTLATRSNIASWTGQAGDARGALELFTALLPDRQRVLGPDHPNTLTTRSNIAYWTGQAGDARGVLELFTALLPDQQRVLGPDHPDTLATRSNIAGWTGESRGCPRRAGAGHGAAARPAAGPRPRPPRHPGHPQQHRQPGPGRAGTPAAHWSCSPRCCPTSSGSSAPTTPTPWPPATTSPLDRGERGCPRRTGVVHRAAARPAAGPRPRPPQHPDHPQQHRRWTGRAGDARGALELFTALLPDRQRVLGPDHPDTLTTRSNIASWTGRAGDARGALELFTALLPDRQRVLGPDHPDVQATQAWIEQLTSNLRGGE